MRSAGNGRAGSLSGRPRLLVMGLLTAIVATAAPAQAQISVSAWGRPLVAVPLGDFAGREDGVEAEPSAGFDVGGSVEIGALRVYGEYQQVDFACGECGEAALEDRVLDRGWGAGVIVPLRASPGRVEPWVRLGVIGHHLRFRAEEEAAYSDASVGWAGGVGAGIRPVRFLRIEPALLIRSYETRFRFAIDLPDRDLSITYLALGLGISLALP